jgi:hypothetical protein
MLDAFENEMHCTPPDADRGKFYAGSNLYLAR